MPKKKKKAIARPSGSKKKLAKKSTAKASTSNKKGGAKQTIDWAKEAGALRETWNKRRQKKRTSPFATIELPTGEIHCRLKEATIGKYARGNDKDKLYIRLGFLIMYGTAKSQTVSITQKLTTEKLFEYDGEDVLALDMVIEWFRKLGHNDVEFEQFPEVVAALNKSKPYAVLMLQNKLKDRNGKYQNVDEWGTRDDGYVQNYNLITHLTRAQMVKAGTEYDEELAP